jgi:hypothetical protein
MLTTIFLLIVLAVIGIAAIPLMMGIVPPNPYYGWPTRQSSSKPDLWRQVNMFLGRAVVIADRVGGVGDHGVQRDVASLRLGATIRRAFIPRHRGGGHVLVQPENRGLAFPLYGQCCDSFAAMH